MWTKKYAPNSLREFVGNSSAIQKIKFWISNFKPDQKQKILLLIGAPGQGKTSVIQLIAKMFDYVVQEYNSSDTRTTNVVKDIMAPTNCTLDMYFKIPGSSLVPSKTRTLLLMDEVDGMVATGITTLMKIAETSKCPIVCICNEETPGVQKLGKSVGTLKIRFYPPDVTEVRARLKNILKAEKIIGISDDTLNNLIIAFDSDIRRLINYLEWDHVGSTHLKFDADQEIDILSKDNIFNITKTLLNSMGNTYDIDSILRCYYNESTMQPLFLQENYIEAYARKRRRVDDTIGAGIMQELAKSAASFSLSDIIELDIYSNQNFELMEFHGIVSTVTPAKTVKGNLDRVTYPQFFPKMSSLNGKTNALNRISDNSKLLALNREHPSVYLEYIVLLFQDFISNGDIDSLFNLAKAYNIDADALKELYIVTGYEDRFKTIDRKIKAAITKTLKGVL